jgi:hypothetical protein
MISLELLLFEAMSNLFTTSFQFFDFYYVLFPSYNLFFEEEFSLLIATFLGIVTVLLYEIYGFL